MRTAKILFKGEEAGVLRQHGDGEFEFQYHERWVIDDKKPAISLTLPKSLEAYHSTFLFPFFYNMLPEGTNTPVVCQLNRIDQQDYFGLLLNTAMYDTIGAVTVIKMEQ
jgi:HipA-like protein